MKRWPTLMKTMLEGEGLEVISIDAGAHFKARIRNRHGVEMLFVGPGTPSCPRSLKNCRAIARRLAARETVPSHHGNKSGGRK